MEPVAAEDAANEPMAAHFSCLKQLYGQKYETTREKSSYYKSQLCGKIAYNIRLYRGVITVDTVLPDWKGVGAGSKKEIINFLTTGTTSWYEDLEL